MNFQDKAKTKELSAACVRSAPPPGVVPLAMAAVGETCELAMVRGANLRQRLADMGLGLGSRFRVEAGEGKGPMVISVRGSRLILGCGMIHKIFIRLTSRDSKSGRPAASQQKGSAS
ncbi:MAG: FeoA family protein [Verrucomicrobiae bacterium]|nr:FeoA family protein [Verrucomicrobiae bacterium]